MSALRLAVLAALALGLGAPAARADADEVRVAGSDSMVRLIEIWAESFQGLRPGVRVVAEGEGSSTGPPALLAGRAQLAAMTRRMSEVELEAFRRRRGREPRAIPVAIDALAVYVNAQNPLERLTLQQVDAIFSRTRRCGAEAPAQHWGDLGLRGDWAERSISVYGRSWTTGTHQFFREIALCGGDFLATVREEPGAESCAMAVGEHRQAIAYGSRVDRKPGIKPLALAAEPGAPFATIGDDDVISGRYPLARTLWLYADAKKLPDAVSAFLDFALSEAGQLRVADAGYLRLPAELRQSSLGALD